MPTVEPHSHPVPSHGHAEYATKQYVDGTTTNVILSGGWSVFGGNYPFARMIRAGSMVFLEGLIKPSSDVASGDGLVATVGSIPAGFRPSQFVMAPGLWSNHTDGRPNVGKIRVLTDGTLAFQFPQGFTGLQTTNGPWVSLNGCYWRL